MLFFCIRFSDTLEFLIQILVLKSCLVTDILVRNEVQKLCLHVIGK